MTVKLEGGGDSRAQIHDYHHAQCYSWTCSCQIKGLCSPRRQHPRHDPNEHSIKPGPYKLRHAPNHSDVLSHTDQQTSIRFPPMVEPNPPSFDDLQHNCYRPGNPQPTPHQHYASGSLDLRAFAHALPQPHNWFAASRLMLEYASTS